MCLNLWVLLFTSLGCRITFAENHSDCIISYNGLIIWALGPLVCLASQISRQMDMHRIVLIAENVIRGLRKLGQRFTGIDGKIRRSLCKNDQR